MFAPLERRALQGKKLFSRVIQRGFLFQTTPGFRGFFISYGLSFGMRKSIDSIQFRAGIWVVVLLIMTGCSLTIPEYPEPILLDDSSISIEYTYGNVDIEVPIKVEEGSPTAYRLTLYSGRDTTKAVIERILMPGDRMAVTLPRSLFLPDTLIHKAVLEPLGDDYLTRVQRFRYTGPTITLPVSTIRIKPVRLDGRIIYLRDGVAVTNADIIVQFPDGNQSTTHSDSAGAFHFTFPADVLKDSLLTVSVVSAGSFPVNSQVIPLSAASKSYSVEFVVGPSAEFYQMGAPYLVMDNLTPFRKGPENGAEIQFLLPKDETIMVTTVAGDRLKAIVELKSERSRKPQYETGWVLAKHVKPIDL